MFKIPDFVPNFLCKRGVYLRFDLIGFLHTIGASWSVPPMEDILSCEFGNFPLGHFLLPGCQVHMRFQINAFPIQVPASPGVFWGIVLPVVSYSCQARKCSLGGDVPRLILIVQNWPLLPRIFPENSCFPISDFPEGMPSHQLSALLSRCPD